MVNLCSPQTVNANDLNGPVKSALRYCRPRSNRNTRAGATQLSQTISQWIDAGFQKSNLATENQQLHDVLYKA